MYHVIRCIIASQQVTTHNNTAALVALVAAAETNVPERSRFYRMNT